MLKPKARFIGFQQIVLASDPAAGDPAREAERTVFVVEPLSQRDAMAYMDGLNTTSYRELPDGTAVRELRSHRYAQSREIALKQIRSVRNFCDATGQPLAWPTLGTVEEKEAFLSLLDEFDVSALADAIRDHAFLVDESGAALGNG